MEDHDRTRCRTEFELQIYDDLEWLGFTPAAESLRSLRAGPSPFRQSDSEEHYLSALRALTAQGLVYGCNCSRADIARELGDGFVEGSELRYPGTCRDLGLEPGPGIGARIKLPDGNFSFDDLALGHQHQRPHSQCGDLLARDRHGNWTYQFAVVVDDLRHQVTHVVRGADLLESTGRQVALARMLGREHAPVFLHHPIIHGEGGGKLSKRDASLSLAAMRGRGMTAANIIAEASRLTTAI
jgi:glutamyl-tRNA synthetase/glutamyl-Q tRNA(Asp) synthetase